MSSARARAEPPAPGPAAGVARRRLDLGLSPVEVLRAVRHRARPVALIGAWHQGEALVAVEPVVELGADDDPFDLRVPVAPADGTVGGGWIGLWGHRLGRRVERLPEARSRPCPQPEHVVGWYDHVLRLVNGTWWAEGLAGPERLRAWVDDLLPDLTAPAPARPHAVGEFVPTPAAAAHRDAVAAVVEHVAAGDVFQANLCMRLDAELQGDPLDVFCAGVEALAPAYAAYVGWDGGAVASLSPELFLRRTGREVLTSPIKGTAALGTDPDELVASAKNRAENVMIVDLMRNDLGRVCAPGSVRVPAVARLERHAVWHLVSDVVGQLRAGLDDGDLLRATFPPGSVSGAPKVRALEVVADLEATGREAYTGAIGHVGPHAGLELNVAIRTFEFARTGPRRWRTWLGVGGGVVADSTPEAEHLECLVKARPLVEAVGGRLSVPEQTVAARRPASAVRARPRRSPAGGVFETVLVVDGAAVDLDQHLARLDASVRSLYGTTVRAGLESAVVAKARGLAGVHRLRVDAVPRAGDVTVSLAVAPVAPEPGPWRLDVQVVPGGWGAHKWVDRDELGAHVPGRDLLLVDDDGSVLETARASFFVVRDDGVHTPPLDGRILPGTMRARAIELLGEEGIPVHQHRLTTADLAAASEVFVTNALRGAVPVAEVGGVGSWPAGPLCARVAERLPPNAPVPRGAVGPPPSQRSGGGPLAAPGRAAAPRVLFVDNYDSFVYNLVQYVGELGARAMVVRNDAADVDELVAMRTAGELTHLVVSPGPGAPGEAGLSTELVRRLGPTTPTLGVCLGHQVIAEVYGGRVTRAPEVVHGKPSLVHHDGRGVFRDLPSPLTCARYHSLVAVEDTLPPELEVTARTASGIVMGLRHRSHPVEGVQMHPESVLTHRGHAMLENFLWT